MLVTSRQTVEENPELAAAIVAALRDGYADYAAEPEAGLDALLAANPALDREVQAAQLTALEGAFEPPLSLDPEVLAEWASWEAEHEIVAEPPRVADAFVLDLGE